MKQKYMLNKCNCGFPSPRPLEEGVSHYAGMHTVDKVDYPKEFFCDFCKGFIADRNYLKAVVEHLTNESKPDSEYKRERYYKYYTSKISHLFNLTVSQSEKQGKE